MKSFPQILRSFFNYINVKRQCRKNVGLLQEEDDHHPNRHMDKAEMFYVFLASVSKTDDGPRGS